MENPNPGSNEAIRLGCLCDIQGNKHGKGFVLGNNPPIFFKEPLCPIHGHDKYCEEEDHEKRNIHT